MEFHNFHPDRIGFVDSETLNRASSVFFTFLLDRHPALINAYINHAPRYKERPSRERLVKDAYSLMTSGMVWRPEFTIYDFPYTIKEFRKPFLKYIDEFGFSEKNVFIAIHYAAAVLTKKDIAKVKWIVFHGHALPDESVWLRDWFSRSKLLLTIRDPRAGIWSFKKGVGYTTYQTIHEARLHLWVYRKAYPAKDILVVRHEDIHLKYPTVTKQVCRFLGIGYDPTMEEATLFGLPWDGSSKKAWNKEHKGTFSFTNVKSSRPDKRFVSDDWKQSLSRSELFWIQLILGKTMREFKYPHYTKKDRTHADAKPNYESILDQPLVWLGESRIRTGIRKAYAKVKDVFLLGSVFRLCIHALIIALGLYRITKQVFFCVSYRLRKARAA